MSTKTTKTRKPYTKIKRAKNGELYATRHGGNHRVLAHTETYKRRAGVENAIRVLAWGDTVIDESEAGK